MDPTTISAVLSPAMAIVLFLNILVGAGSVLAAGGNLGPFKLSPTAATYLAPVVAVASGSVTFISKTASSQGSAFAFSAMLVVTALLVGFGTWIASAAAGQAVQHHASVGALAKARDAKAPTVVK